LSGHFYLSLRSFVKLLNSKMDSTLNLFEHVNPTPLFNDRSRLLPAREKRSGFSLIEVTIALGVVTFAAVSILGLLPTGLLVMRDAMNQTVESQIVRSIAGQSVVANFANLTNGSPFYFNDEGQRILTAEGSVYTVSLSNTTPIYPGSTNAGANLSASLVNLRIQIVERRSQQAVGITNLRTLQVANYGK